MNKAFEVMAVMRLEDLISNPLARINKELKGTEKQANTLTAKMAKFGKALAGVATAGALMLSSFGAMTASAAEFEQGIANMSTLFGDVDVDIKNLEKSVLNLSASSGIAASEINDALLESLSSGIPATEDMGQALAFVEKSAKLAKSGFTSVATVVDATTSVLNAYRMDVSKTDAVHKILQQTQNIGKTTVEQLGQSLAQVTPVAASMGVSFEQVGAAVSTLTNAGVKTAESMTQLKALFSELGKTGTMGQKALMEAARGTELAGLSFSEMMERGVSLADMLNIMGDYAKKNNIKMLDLFSSIEAGSAALSLSGQNASMYNNALKEMGTTSDVVGDAYNKVTETMNGALSRLSTSTSALFITIGKTFTPIISRLADGMAYLAKIMTAVADNPVGAFIIRTVAAFSALVAGIGAAVGAFLLLKLALAPVVASLAALGAPFIAIIAVVGALYLAFKNNLFGISDIIKNAFNKVVLVIKGVVAVFQTLKDGQGEIKGALAEKIEANGLIGVVTTISKIVFRVTQVFKGFADIMKIYVANALIKIQPYISAVSRVFSFLGSIVSKVYSFIFGDIVSESKIDIWRKFGEIIATVVVAPFNILATVLGGIGSALNYLFDKLSSIIDFFSNIDLAASGKKLVETFTSGIASVINKPKEMLESGLSKLRQLLPFSDAKEGPLSTLTLSGQRMMTTLADGVEMASPDLKKTTTKALGELSLDNTAKNIQVEPITKEINNTNNHTNSNKVINIKIENITLENVKDGSSFIKELEKLALSFGVV